MKILITSGATQEKIDEIRYITNISTGETGACLAEQLADEDHEVVYVHSVGAKLPVSLKVERFSYTDYVSLDRLLSHLLSQKSFDVVFHAAAVADFSVSEVVIGKTKMIPKKLTKIESNEDISLILKKNPKIIEKLASISKNPAIQIVAFKLTHGTEPLLSRFKKTPGVKWVVHNDFNEIKAAKNGDHPFHVYELDILRASPQSKLELARFFCSNLSTRLLTQGLSSNENSSDHYDTYARHW